MDMGFGGFVMSAVIGVGVALVMTNLPQLKLKLPGGVTTTIVVGYLGARLGSLALGNWHFLILQGISILPAILGAVAAILLVNSAVECCKNKK